MRRAVVGATVAWLAAASVAAQEPPLLTVETLNPAPTVVKTSEPLVQAYRVRFPDLIEDGKEVIVLEDRMAPENVAVHPFEAVALDVAKRQVGGEYIWDFTYTFRIVNPEKANYVIPPFSFYWLLRDLGQSIEEAEVQLVDTHEVYVRYVSTVTDDPLIDIRDTIDLGTFGTRATVLKAIAWTVAPLPLLVWLVMLIKLARQPKRAARLPVKRADAESELLDLPDRMEVSSSQARRRLRGHLRTLSTLDHENNGQPLLDVHRHLVMSFKDFLRAELPELNSGDTPKDIKLYIERRVKDGLRKDALLVLASRMILYQSGLETGTPSSVGSVHAEAKVLDESLAQLKRHARAWMRVKAMVGRVRDSVQRT